MKKSLLILFGFLLVFACKEKYMPEINMPGTGYLVVEGYISNGNITQIRLTRTNKLVDTSNIVYVSGATVVVQSMNTGASYPLVARSQGLYESSAPLNLNAADQYRLHITIGQNTYASEYSAVRVTPDIDSISWDYTDEGVTIFANTHDPSGNSKYYQYKFDETWEFHSDFVSSLKIKYNGSAIVGLEPRFPDWRVDTTIQKCWKTRELTDIVITSSEKLTEDRVSRFPLIFIPKGSWELSVLYSINLQQYVPSAAGYRFLEQLKRNTEQLGTIFDAQPSDNIGNLRCLSNPSEPVIGFVEVMQEKKKRIFISNAQLPNWRYHSGCPAQVLVVNDPDSIALVSHMIPTLVNEARPNGTVANAYFGEAPCVDCTTKGVNVKPSFWP